MYNLNKFIAIASLVWTVDTAAATPGLSPLQLAAGAGDAKLVRQLVAAGASVLTVEGDMGVSVLHKAVYSGSAATVAAVLEAGAIVDAVSPSNGNTALHDALYFRNGAGLDVVQALLRHGASLSIRNRAGFIPQESATILGHTDIAQLLSAEAKARFPDTARDLMIAVRANDVTTVTRLLDEGAPINVADEQGFSPVIWAARQGYDELVTLLLDRGADVNQVDTWMRATAGHKAAFWGRASTLGILITRGLDINAQGGYNGYTALHDAVAGQHVAAVRELVNGQARCDIGGHDGQTALTLAAKTGNAEVLQLLAGCR